MVYPRTAIRYSYGLMTESGVSHEDRAAVHESGRGSLRGHDLGGAEERNPQSGRQAHLFPGSGHRAVLLEPDRDRHHRPEVLPQGGSAEGQGAFLAGLGSDRQGTGPRGRSRTQAYGRRRRARRAPGFPPSRLHLAGLGKEKRLLRCCRGRKGLLRRDLLHAGPPDGRSEQSPVVQYRPVFGLRHRRPGAGTLFL